MSDLLDIRIGNYFEFWGPFGRQNVVVEGVENLNGKRQKFMLQHLNNPGESFNGYSEQIIPIFFREQHLNDLGFDFDDKIKTHKLNGLTLSSFYYIEGSDQDNLTFGFTNYYILPVGFTIPPTKEQVQENAIEIPYVHVMQNFCSDNNILLDFSELRNR